MKILCVAEKNDAAKNIATQLRSSFINLIGVSQAIAILESDLGKRAFQKRMGKEFNELGAPRLVPHIIWVVLPIEKWLHFWKLK